MTYERYSPEALDESKNNSGYQIVGDVFNDIIFRLESEDDSIDDESKKNPAYQMAGDVFNDIVFRLEGEDDSTSQYERRLHYSLPIIQCNRFLPNALGSGGSAVVNKKMEVIGVLIKRDFAFSGIALHVSVIRKFIGLCQKEREKSLTRLRSLRSLKNELREKMEKKSKNENETEGEACTSGPVSTEQASDFILPVAKFILECDAQQICMAPGKFICVCKRLKEYVELLEAPMLGEAPLLTAVKKLESSLEQLTNLHADFLQLCLLPKCYKTGFRILDATKFEVDQPKDLYLYCYYGGMICIGLKRYPKALELLHNVVTAPMSSLSVEAYKKYILVSLIHLGQLSASSPKYTSATAQKDLKNSSQVKLYIELVSCYGHGKVSELEVFIQANKEKFECDHNLELVKQVLSSIYKRNIQRLTQTYLTLSLEDIAKTVELSSPREAEMHVLQMIQDGEIYAEINQKDGIVRFLEDPEQYKTCEMIERIDFSTQRMMGLSKKLTTELISCDSQHPGKAGKERQRFDFDDVDPVPVKIQRISKAGASSGLRD